MQRTKVKTARQASGLRLPFMSALTALALALSFHAGRAQGIVRGAQQGASEGNRIAGPVGGVVGGAVGAGVGGAVGAVEGVFGVPHYHHWHHHCRGFYDHRGYYHCYR